MARTSRALPSRMIRALLLWPVFALWRLVTAAANALGIVLSLVVALVMIGVGLFLSSTFVGIIFGLPILILGIFLLARALY